MKPNIQQFQGLFQPQRRDSLLSPLASDSFGLSTPRVKPLVARFTFSDREPVTLSTGKKAATVPEAAAAFAPMGDLVHAQFAKYGLGRCFECRGYFLEEFHIQTRTPELAQQCLEEGSTLVQLNIHDGTRSTLFFVSNPAHSVRSPIELQVLIGNFYTVFNPGYVVPTPCYRSLSYILDVSLQRTAEDMSC